MANGILIKSAPAIDETATAPATVALADVSGVNIKPKVEKKKSFEKLFISTERLSDLMGELPSEVNPEIYFEELVKAGHEIEGYNAKFNILDTIKNIPESGVQFGKDIGSGLSGLIPKDPQLAFNEQQILNPGIKNLGKNLINAFRQTIPPTIKNLSKFALGALEKITPGEQSHEKIFDGLVDAYIERYGSKEKALNTIEKDPIGFLADLSAVVTGAGGAATKIGTVGKLGKVAKVGGKISKLGRALEPTVLAVNTAKGFNKLTRLNKALSLGAQRLTKTGIGAGKGNERALATQIKKSGSPVKLLNDHGIYGSLEDISEQLGTIHRKSKAIVDDGLASIGKTFKKREAGQILILADNFLSGDPRLLGPKFANMKDRIGILKKTLKNEGLTLSEMNEVKRMSDTLLNSFKKSGELKATRQAQNMGQIRAGLNTFIDKAAAKNGVPGINKMNRQTQWTNAMKKLIDDTRKTTPVTNSMAERVVERMAIGGGVTGVLLENPAVLGGAAAIVGVSKLMANPRIRTWVASRLQLMSMGEFKALEAGIKTGKKSREFERAARAFRRDFAKTFPELRLAGKTSQQVEGEVGGASGEF